MPNMEKKFNVTFFDDISWYVEKILKNFISTEFLFQKSIGEHLYCNKNNINTL